MSGPSSSSPERGDAWPERGDAWPERSSTSPWPPESSPPWPWRVAGMWQMAKIDGRLLRSPSPSESPQMSSSQHSIGFDFGFGGGGFFSCFFFFFFFFFLSNTEGSRVGGGGEYDCSVESEAGEGGGGGCGGDDGVGGVAGVAGGDGGDGGGAFGELGALLIRGCPAPVIITCRSTLKLEPQWRSSCTLVGGSSFLYFGRFGGTGGMAPPKNVFGWAPSGGLAGFEGPFFAFFLSSFAFGSAGNPPTQFDIDGVANLLV